MGIMKRLNGCEIYNIIEYGRDNIINSGWCSVATLPRQCVQVSRKIRESAKKGMSSSESLEYE